MRSQYIESFGNFQHIALIGPTEGGKTYFIKRLFADNKLSNFNGFTLIGHNNRSIRDNESPVDIFAKLFAGSQYYYNKNDYTDENKCLMSYFPLSEMKTAMVALNGQSKYNMLVFVDDALTADNSGRELSSFINKAKHDNCTLIVTMHNPTNNAATKKIRDACRWFIFVNTSGSNLKALTNLRLNDPILIHYESIVDPHQKILIYDTLSNKFFDSSYNAINK